MSFTDVTTYIKALLEADVDLEAFCQTCFNNSIQVKKVFTPRTEIHSSALPIILITRPDTEGEAESSVGGTYKHSIRLYIGFYWTDPETAQDTIIKFEERIEATIMKNPTLGGLVDFIAPSNSVNDEGKRHPNYFIVKDLTVSKETVWTSL